MTNHAHGTFDVKLEPQPPSEQALAASLGRMTIDKQFHGDLEAVSMGEMLAYRTAVDGSAGYVAMEKVTGSLQGRAGTFVLQHTGAMDRGTPRLTVSVVPDSGTEELAGLTGTMAIIISDGLHSYAFDYELAATT
jgi:hypothetical protein